MQLDLQRRAQLGGQNIDGLMVQDRLGIGVRGGAGTEQPQDVFALAADDAIERENIGLVWFRSRCSFTASASLTGLRRFGRPPMRPRAPRPVRLGLAAPAAPSGLPGGLTIEVTL